MTRIRRALAPLAGLLLNAATGLLAVPLLALVAVCAIGRPLPPRALAPVRALAGFHRARAARALGHELPPPSTSRALEPENGAPADGSPAGWRVVVWLAVHAVMGPGSLLVVGAILATTGVIWRLRLIEVSGAVTFTLSLSLVAIVAIAPAVTVLLHIAQAWLAESLLRPGSSMAQRIAELTRSRAAAVDAQAAERRRIERDLHDGAQARLIAIRMSLGLARGASDPAQVHGLVEEAWESAGQALIDLRDLVRGIHPPVLADRGLGGAIQATALLCPVPVDVEIDLRGRPEPPVESALYFAAAEALTNVSKHSDASKAWVRLHHANGMLRLTVGDDGHGGIAPMAGSDIPATVGGGLAGIRGRLSAFDGTLAVHSPVGGPTELTMELPCALSSPKISHS